MSKETLSVVPIKFVPATVPLLPVNCQAVPEVTGVPKVPSPRNTSLMLPVKLVTAKTPRLLVPSIALLGPDE